MQRTATLNLSDLKVYVGTKLYNVEGFEEENESSYLAVVKDSNRNDSILFFNGSNLWKLHKNYLPDETINIVIPGLRQYFNLSNIPSEYNLFNVAMSTLEPKFKDISDYNSDIKELSYSRFQLFGDITPYDVLHLKVKDYITAIKDNVEFIFNVKGYGVIYIKHDSEYARTHTRSLTNKNS